MKPFIFFHLRKAGGSSFRRWVYAASQNQQLTSYIPCYPYPYEKLAIPRISCESYFFPYRKTNAKQYHVFGGHLYYPSLQKYFYMARHDRSSILHDPSDDAIKFSCFIMFRAPQTRVRSCWNYRFSGSNDFKEASDMTPKELEFDLPRARSRFGEGCNNEAVRILSDQGLDERKLGFLTYGNTWSHDVVDTLQLSMGRMERCVIGLIERCTDTKKIVSHYLPWLASSVDCTTRLKQQVGDQQTKAERPMSQELQHIIAQQNIVDQTVYEYAELLFDELLKIAQR